MAKLSRHMMCMLVFTRLREVVDSNEIPEARLKELMSDSSPQAMQDLARSFHALLCGDVEIDLRARRAIFVGGDKALKP